jgi:SRSO17 transposase
LTYATGRGHALIGRALYLPGACAADEEHRELAGVPEEVLFATKPQLAGGLPDRAQSLGIRGRCCRRDSRSRLAPDAHRVRDQGTRHYDWAMLEVTSDETPGGHDGGHSVLLARRHRYTGTLSYCRCWTPGPVPLSRLIAIAVTRWRIEEDHQLARQSTGLDAGQVIRWKSWHRWTAICLLAYLYLYLAVAVAVQRQPDTGSDLEAGLIPITVPELQLP